MSGITSFEERLARIGQDQSHSSAPQPNRPKPAPKRRTTSTKSITPIAMLCAVVIVGGMALFPSGADTAAAPPAPESNPMTLFGSLFGTKRVDNFAASPLRFLPKAPAGMQRITSREAGMPTTIEALSTAWPQNARRLEDHRGFETLQDYVRVFSTNGLSFDIKYGKRFYGSAVYLDAAKGTYLDVYLDPSRKPEGIAGDPLSWMRHLERREEKRRVPNSQLKKLKVADTTVLIWLSQNELKKGAMASIRAGGDIIKDSSGIRKIPATYEVAVAMNEHLVLRMKGWASINEIEAILATIDPAVSEFRPTK